MKRVQYHLCVFLSLSLFMPSLWADVVATRTNGTRAQTSASRVLESRLVELELQGEEVVACVTTLPPDDVAYLAQAPQRIQRVGQVQNLWYESVFGVVGLVGLTAAVLRVFIHNRDT